MDQYMTYSVAWQRTAGQLDVECAHQFAGHIE